MSVDLVRELIGQFDAAIRSDPAQRGLIASEPQFGPLCPGHLAAAAEHLARYGRKVAIVTGFFIPAGEPPAAETDGPPGALVLAQSLLLLGIDALVITDGYCFEALAAAARASGLGLKRIAAYPHSPDRPFDPDATARWRADFFRDGPGKGLSHLIAIERVGPSHTLESLVAQPRAGKPPLERFQSRAPIEHRDHCHNMRGDNIDAFAGDLHRLFADARARAPATGLRIIGIGDGANEIGMGSIPWEELERRLSGDQAARVPCRIAADWNIVAGTSNWGGYALAASVALLHGKCSVLSPFTARHEQHVLEAMVAEGPAVDGVTRRREPTVDGLPLATYLQPWLEIRGKLGLPE